MENDGKPWKIAALTFPNHIEHLPTLSTIFLSFPGVWKVTPCSRASADATNRLICLYVLIQELHCPSVCWLRQSHFFNVCALWSHGHALHHGHSLVTSFLPHMHDSKYSLPKCRYSTLTTPSARRKRLWLGIAVAGALWITLIIYWWFYRVSFWHHLPATAHSLRVRYDRRIW